MLPAVRTSRRSRLRRVALVTAVTSLMLGLAHFGSGSAATPPRSFPAIADTFVNAAYPTNAFGSKAALKVDDGPKITFLRFDTRALVGSRSATVLRLRSTSASAPGRIEVHVLDDPTSWAEYTATFRSAPPLGRRVGSGIVRPDSWTEVPLDPTAVGDGMVSLAVVRSTPGRDVQFYSRESTDPPALVLTPGTGPATEGSGPVNPPPAATRLGDTTPGVTPPEDTSPEPSVLPAGGTDPAPAPAPPPRPRPDPAAGSPFLAYDADSFFRTPLPDAAPVDRDNALGISLVRAHDASEYPRINGVGGNKWGMPYAMSSCADPVWTLTGSVPSEVAFLKTAGFHAPVSLVAALTGTSDSPMVVVDRCGNSAMPAGLTLWAANATRGGGNTIQVGTAGAFDHASNGLDRRNPLSDSDVNFRSRGAIPDAMVIRDDLLANAIKSGGDLGHVLHMFWWETDSAAGAVHPMTGAESGKSGFGAEGMRIRIKSDVQLESRGCSPAGLAVAKTLQQFGAYLGDNSGSSTALKAEQGSSAITPDALSCVTWNDFVFVQRGWDG